MKDDLIGVVFFCCRADEFWSARDDYDCLSARPTSARLTQNTKDPQWGSLCTEADRYTEFRKYGKPGLNGSGAVSHAHQSIGCIAMLDSELEGFPQKKCLVRKLFEITRNVG